MRSAASRRYAPVRSLSPVFGGHDEPHGRRPGWRGSQARLRSGGIPPITTAHPLGAARSRRVAASIGAKARLIMPSRGWQVVRCAKPLSRSRRTMRQAGRKSRPAKGGVVAIPHGWSCGIGSRLVHGRSAPTVPRHGLHARSLARLLDGDLLHGPKVAQRASRVVGRGSEACRRTRG